MSNLETQGAIVAEIEAKQSLVNANRELLERFEKKIRAAGRRGGGGAEIRQRARTNLKPDYFGKAGRNAYESADEDFCFS